LCYNTARLAVQAGAAGIIVSNHGARQLDYVPATIMALEEVHCFFFWHLHDFSAFQFSIMSYKQI
jgi:hypothetical protein